MLADRHDPPRPAEHTRLKRVIELPWLILYGLGSTVGAGIYVLIGAVAGRAGAAAPLAFAVASILALATAISFAELSARYPSAGGALVYVREGLERPRLSLAVGLLTALAGVVSAATVSLGFVGYLAELLALPRLLALLVVVGLVGGLAAWGVRESVVAAGLVTLVEVAGLAAILVFGAVEIGTSPPGRADVLVESFATLDWRAIAGAAVLAFYAYLGFEDIVNVAEEVKDVRRALPRAVVWTLGLSTLLYVAVAAVAVVIVPPAELASAEAPLALVFERSGGSAALLAAIALAAMLNGALVQIVMASRILLSLARHGQVPAIFAWIHPIRRTPLAATLAASLTVAGLAAAFPLAGLAAATASIALAVFSLVNLSLLRLLWRSRHAEASSGFAGRRLPLWLPAFGALSSAAFLALEIASRFVPWLADFWRVAAAQSS